MRGAVVKDGTEIDGRRITPAYAGSSIEAGILEKAAEDHPRVCGEQCIGFFVICDF